MIEDKLGHLVVGKEGRMKSRPPLQPAPRKKKKTPTEELAADLSLRLQIKEDLNKDEMLRLGEDITMFVRSMINSGKKTEAIKFIRHNKDSFSADIKDLIKTEISLMGVN
jgi:hypothetical protein